MAGYSKMDSGEGRNDGRRAWLMQSEWFDGLTTNGQQTHHERYCQRLSSDGKHEWHYQQLLSTGSTTGAPGPGERKGGSKCCCRHGGGVSPALIAVEVTPRLGPVGGATGVTFRENFLEALWADAPDGLGLSQLMLCALFLSHGRA